MWSECRWDITTKSSLLRSTPNALTLCSKISASPPVSKRIRLPPYSTSTENPQAFVIAGDFPNASYKIVTRLPDWAAARQGNSKRITVRLKEIRDRISSPLTAGSGVGNGQDYKPG